VAKQYIGIIAVRGTIEAVIPFGPCNFWALCRADAEQAAEQVFRVGLPKPLPLQAELIKVTTKVIDTVEEGAV
jgi:hypothetical protein